MGTWIGMGYIPWNYFSSGTFCGIGSDQAYDHAWPMAIHWTGYAYDYRNYNQGCWSSMYHLYCGQTGTAVYSSSNGYQINYVRTADVGPCLRNDPTYPCGPPTYCGAYTPNLIGDITQAAFLACGHNLSEGLFLGYVWQP